MGNSLIFTSASSQNLTATGKTSINQQKFTISFWFKQSSTGATRVLFDFSDGTNNNKVLFELDSTNRAQLIGNVSGSTVMQIVPSATYTDTASWHHWCVAVDTTQVTAANRIKLYFDGTLITAFTTNTIPAQNTNLGNNFASTYYIGSAHTGVQFYNGNLAQVYYIDGQQLTPASFISGTPGIPITYSGSYTGTFDFFLSFSDATSTTTLGLDSSGENNNWTLNNMTTANQSPDYPSSTIANFAGVGLLNANGFVTRVAGYTSFSGAGLFGANGFATLILDSANLTGAGLLSANATLLIPINAFFSGAGLLNARAGLLIPTGANFAGSGLLGATLFSGGIGGAAFTGNGLLNANGYATLVLDAANLSGAGALLANSALFIPPLVPQQVLYVFRGSLFADPLFVAQSFALIFGGIDSIIAAQVNHPQLLVTKPDGSQLSIGFPLCFVGEVDIPFRYFPPFLAGTYCVGQVYGSVINEAGNWVFQVLNGGVPLTDPVTIFVNPQ